MLLTLIPLALAGDPLPAPTVELGGFVETYVAHNFNNPANGVTNLRGFDARSDTFALSLASVSVGLKHKFFATKVALQVGPTAASYFGAEPTTPAGFGVSSTSAANLQFVREAWAGGTAPVLGGLTVEGGVFLSPVGYDSIAVKDNHFWSLSNLGVGLPFYFTGARVRQDFGQGTVLTVGVFNGWNSVVDNNKGKSVSAWATHTFNSGAKIQGLYMGGPEAAGDGPHPWRNTFDLWADVPIGPVSVIAAADGGFELREAGPQTWQAGQLAVEVRPHPGVMLGVRGDIFHEHGPAGPAGNIFWPVDLLGSFTGSLGFKPVDQLITRLEVRHDRASGPAFYGADPDAPTESNQTTITLGVTGFFDASLPLPSKN